MKEGEPEPSAALLHAQLFERALDPLRHQGPRIRDRVLRVWRVTWARMLRLGGISAGNQILVYTDGDLAFEAMVGAIDNAKECVWLETYIFVDDRVGRAVRDALIAARERGCDVVLLYDQWGSQDLPEHFFEVLRAAGGQITAFNPVGRFFSSWRATSLPRTRLFSPLVRDHRKVLVIDGRLGFCGGMNISEDYAGERLGRATFRDTHASVQGPAVAELADIFQESLEMMLARRPRKRARAQRTLKPIAKTSPDQVRTQEGGALVQVLRSNVLLRRTQIQRALRQSVQRSVERCWLTTPYFVPPRRLMRRLRHAARRGVDVRVLTAGKSDVPAVRWASQYLYASLLKSGVRIFELQSKTLHAKTAVVDGLYSTIGSFNLDRWSFRRNLEVNLAIVEAALAQSMERQFEQDLRKSEEVLLSALESRSLWQRFRSWLAYRFARL